LISCYSTRVNVPPISPFTVYSFQQYFRICEGLLYIRVQGSCCREEAKARRWTDCSSSTQQDSNRPRLV